MEKNTVVMVNLILNSLKMVVNLKVLIIGLHKKIQVREEKLVIYF